MKLRSIMLVSAALAFSASTTAAWAQSADQSATTPAPQAKKAHDPNEVVCQKIEEIGSRLATKRVCMTRAEWAEQQRQDRMDTDKAQVLRPCQQGSGC